MKIMPRVIKNSRVVSERNLSGKIILSLFSNGEALMVYKDNIEVLEVGETPLD